MGTGRTGDRAVITSVSVGEMPSSCAMMARTVLLQLCPWHNPMPKETLDFIHRVHAGVDRPANFASCDLFTAANNDIIIGTRLKFSQMIGLIRNGTHRIIFPPQMRFRYHLALPLSLAKNRAFPVMLAGTFIVKIGVRS